MSDRRPLAVFRADAAPRIGGGHIMRCLSLADRLARAGWAIGFACSKETPGTVPSLAEAATDLLLLDANDLFSAKPLRHHWPMGCDALVVDHYSLGTAFEAACRPWATR